MPQRTPTINNPTTAASGVYTVVATIAGCPSASASTNVQVNATPVVSIAGDTAICIGTPNVLTASGAASYMWTNGGLTPSISASPATTTSYGVVGTSGAGCPSVPETVTVHVFALPTVDLGPDTSSCDSFVLDAGPVPLDYLWSTGETTQTITVSATGTYSVTVQNGDSCVASDTANVTIFNTVLADLGLDQDICPWDTAFLGTAPVNFASYSWSTGASTPSIGVQTSGNYYVDVVDANGCPSSDTVGVNVWALLSGDIGADTLICDGDSLLLDASGWGGATHAWTPGGATSSSITATTQAQYSVVIDDGNGCIYHDSLDLVVDVPPVISLSSSVTSSCQGDPVTFTVSPTGLPDYDFMLGGASQQTGSGDTWTTLGLQAGDSVTVVGATASGCPTNVAAAASVTVLPRPTGVTMSDTVCVGFASTLITVPSAGTTLSWTGGGGLSGTTDTITHTYPQAGTYGYTVTIDNGTCDTTLIGNVVVLPEPVAPVAPDDSACVGQDALLASSGAGTVEWFDAAAGGNLLATGNSLPLAAVTVSDTFWVRETVAGCIGPRTQVVLSVFQNPVADFISSPDTTVRLDIPRSQVQFVNMSSGATSYLWDFGDGMTSTDPAPVHSFFDVGDFTVTLVAMTREGCADTIGYGPFEVVDHEEEFYVPSAFTPNGDGDNDVWIIDELFYFPDNKLIVFNRWGTTIFEVDGYQNDWDGTYKGDPLPEGTYYYFLDLGDGSDPQKGFVMLYR